MSLKDFINAKKKEVKASKIEVPLSELKRRLKGAPKTRDFLKPFKDFTLIAEIKKASPSEGIIDENADVLVTAKQYKAAGVKVISVLTDKTFFHGDINYLPKVKDAVSLPILRKDFIIDEYQIYESRVYGADAILLIAGALSIQKLEKFIDLTHKLGMECLVEIHNKSDLKKILKIINKIKVIGINNRNLDTLKTDLSVTENLIAKIPENKILISESGINDRKDVQRIRELGANGILTGTAIMKTKDKISAIKSLLATGSSTKIFKNPFSLVKMQTRLAR